MLEEDWINELATAARKLWVERIAMFGYAMCLESNNVPATEENTKPYRDALNSALADVYFVLRMLGVKAGKPPVNTFNGERKCDARCRNAKGYECHCQCGSIYHGINTHGKRSYTSV
jgi:hypothetical protein